VPGGKWKTAAPDHHKTHDHTVNSGLRVLATVERNFKLSINPDDQRTFGPCGCCSNMTERIVGYVYENDAAPAAYFVQWTPGHSDQTASFDMIIERCSEGTTASDRVAVALDYRCLDAVPALMVVDASPLPVARNVNVSRALTRDQAIGIVLANLRSRSAMKFFPRSSAHDICLARTA